jgi:ESX-1 secreted protein B PE domain
MGDELRVDTNDLRSKANEINGIKWATPGDEGPITPPSALTTSVDAVANLAKCARAIWEYQNWGSTEGKRLAESLYHVAKAYDEVDLRAKGEINAGKPITNGPVKPDDCSIPPPVHPTPPGIPGKVGHASGDPEEVENALKTGDQGAALRTVAGFWRATGNHLQGAAERFHVRIQNWEGAAAEVAYGRFSDFGGWLEGLAGSWQQLAGEADKIYDAHKAARDQHTPIYDNWMALKKQLETASDEQKPAIHDGLLKQYAESEHVRGQYAAAATIDRVQPPEPRDGNIQTPVNTNGDPRRRAVPATDKDQENPPLAGTGGEGGSPGGAAPSAGAASPMAAGLGQPAAPQQPAAAQTGAGGGTPSGSPGGASDGSKPGGAPSGGMPGGMPAAAKASPHLPKGPSVKPASAGGGEAGAGGGGGVPAEPLQPAVTGAAVSPGHPSAAHGAEAGKAGAAAPMAGGMGGMPMGGHGGQGQGGKDKRRSPGVSPDEELYKEDRAWTEGVIGNRRRKEVQDARDSGELQ